MKSILMKVAAVLAAMPRFVWQKVCVCGEWISQLVAVPAMPVEAAPAPGGEASGNTADLEEIKGMKRLAGVLVQDQTPSEDDTKGLSDKAIDWLRALDRRSLCAVLAADASQLRAHMRGKAPIRGMVPYDTAAIKDVLAANARQPEPRKTLRAALAEQGIHP
ncbi:hypothetical protein [Pelagibacterium sediminicola]|uniref:hypothetical protein n=1 Tax=Pelagibacterium sediminicola TaxID=2248761 RepID=UPI0013008C4A|nr:hypothetical protein [Pelagibacterium sediminicola]